MNAKYPYQMQRNSNLLSFKLLEWYTRISVVKPNEINISVIERAAII